MLRPLLAIAFSLSLLAACQTPATSPSGVSTPGSTTSPAETSDSARLETLKGQFLENYAQNVYLNYQDAHTQALALQAAVDAF